MYCIETKDLNYSFSSSEKILNNIQLKVPNGSIYGFLGPNGAGKTTTLRLLLGLLKMQSGEICIFNKSFSKNRIDILKNIGSLIESPSLYGHLSARENLSIWQKIYQCTPKRIDIVLELVGLSHTGKKKTSSFSLGMKQRLGIAIALLHAPSLLILDEPTNGLDPNGIIEIRKLLQYLNTQLGITILISSHILSEVEKMVSDIGIIHQGYLLSQGSYEYVMRNQQSMGCIHFETSNNEEALQFFPPFEKAIKLENNKITIPIISNEEIAGINRQLVQNNISVYSICAENNDLEKVFMQLIKN